MREYFNRRNKHAIVCQSHRLSSR